MREDVPDEDWKKPESQLRTTGTVVLEGNKNSTTDELQIGESQIHMKDVLESSAHCLVNAEQPAVHPDEPDFLPEAKPNDETGGHATKADAQSNGQASNEKESKGTSTSTMPRDLPHGQILLVEDNLVNQRVLKRQLERTGLKVHVANHGGEALDLLRKSSIWEGGQDSSIDPWLILMGECSIFHFRSICRIAHEHRKQTWRCRTWTASHAQG